MNIKEIYVLNRALDGKDILYMPSFRNLGISEIMISAIKDGMIKRGLLKNYTEFTDEGIRIADRIRRYKSAKKHMRIDNLLIGVINEKESILILWNPLLAEYSIRLIDSSMGTDQICEGYGFLSEESNETDCAEVKLSYNELLAKFIIDSNNSFRLSTNVNGKKSDEIYFKADSRLYVYDYLKNNLYLKNKSDILGNLSERMSIA